MDKSVGKLVGVSGCWWVLVGELVDVGGCRWVSVGVGGCQWVSVGVGGCWWKSLGVGGRLWETVGDGGGEICKNTCLFSLGCTKKTKKKPFVDNVGHSGWFGQKKATNTLQGGDDSDDTVSLNSSSEFIKQDLSSDSSNDSDYCYSSDDGSDYEEYDDDDDEDEYENEENKNEDEDLDDDLFDEEHQEQQPDGFGWKSTTAGHCS